MSSIQARLEVIEALLTGQLSPEEARVLRTKALKRSSRGRLLLRFERIEKAVARLPQNSAQVPSPIEAHW